MTQSNPYEPPQAEERSDSLDTLQLPRSERVTIDANTLVGVHSARFGRTPLMIRIGAFAMGTLSLLICVISLFVLATRPNPNLALAFTSLGLSGVLLCFLGILGGRINHWSIKRWFALTDRPREVEFVFTRQGVQARSVRGEADARWSDIRKWQGEGDVVLAWHERKNFLIMPTHQFSAETRELIEYVRESQP